MNLKTTQIYLSLFLSCFSIIIMSGQDGVLQPYSPDPAFTSPFGNNTFEQNGVFSINTLPDNKIIAGGFFKIGNSNNYSCLVRLNEDGSLDQDLITSPVGSVNAVIVLADGRIVIGGMFSLGSSNQLYCLARLNSNGSIDGTFAPVTGDGIIYSMALQSDGKIVAGGYFNTIGGVATANLARFTTDGSVDTTLTLTEGADSTGFNGQVNSVAVLPDGKILAVGGFNLFSGISANHIARLTANGSFDTTFTIGTGADHDIWSLHVKPDGKLLIGGGFTTLNGAAVNGFGCLNADGTLDITFNPGGLGVSGEDVSAIAIDAEGRILIGGDISSYNGALRANFVRLNSDGTLDDNFNNQLPDVSYPNGFTAKVWTIKIQPDGKILAGGLFNNYKDNVTTNIARLMGGEFLGTENFIKNKIYYFPNPVSDILYINSASTVTGVRIVSLAGQVVKEIATPLGLNAIDMSGLQAGCYIVNAATASGTTNFKIVKN